MDAIDAIFSRRSIRKYSAETVPEELVTDLLRAAMAAPSSMLKSKSQFRDR